MTIRRLMFVVALLLPAIRLTAASPNAVLWGNVYDASGKPAPGVTIVLDNPSFAFQRTTLTGSDGSYTISEVPPASGYRVTAIKNGERWDVRLGIVVNVGDDLVVIPPLRQPSATLASGSGARMRSGARTDTIATSISGVISGEQLRELPLFNRNFLSLGLLTPNTHDVEPGSPLAGASFSVSGARASENDFLLDGTENIATSTNQAIPFQVNDSIQEFRVVSSTANAEFGRTLGGIINVVTRRASNAFHGSVFGYFASDIFNAGSPLSVYNGSTFDKAAAYAGDPKSNFGGAFPLTYNDYVASAELNGLCTDSIVGTQSPGTVPCGNYVTAGESGPVFTAFGKNTRFDPAALLARLDSHKQPFNSQQFGVNAGGAPVPNRLFVFGSYEGTRIDNPNAIFERVPSEFDRTYNPLAAAGVQSVQFTESGPVTGPVTPPAFAPTDPNYTIALGVLNLFPKANVAGVPDALEFYRGEAPNYTHVNNTLLRADFVASAESTLTLRYAVQHLDQLHDDTLPAQRQYTGNGALRASLNQNFTLGYTRNLSSGVISESRIGFSRFNLRERPQDQGLDVQSAVGLPFASLPTVLLNGIDPQNSGASTERVGAFGAWLACCGTSHLLTFTTQGPTLDFKFPFARIGAPLTAPSQTLDFALFVSQTFTLTRGKHNFRFGADYRRNNNSYFDGSFARGLIYSGNIGQFTSNSQGCPVGALFCFAPNAFTKPTFDFAQRTPTPYLGHFARNVFAGFLQDTWRVRRSLTLNLGVRYEYFSPPTESSGNIWNWDPSALGLVQQGHTTVFNPFGLDCVPDSTFVYPSQPAADSPPLITQPCSSTGRAQFIRPDYRNFGPRVGVAWDVFGTGKTVLRAAAGWFYDPVPVRLIEQLVYNRPLTGPNGFAGTTNFPGTPFAVGNSILIPSVQQQNTLNPAFPNSFYSVLEQPFAVYAIDSQHSRTPYTRQISVSLQQQVTTKFVAEVDYVGNAARRLPVVYNANFGDEFNIPFAPPGSVLLGPELLLYPVFTETNQASGDYHGLVVQGRVGQWHGLQFHASYTWSKSLDNQASASFPVVPITANNFNLGYLNQFSPTFTCLYQNRKCGLAPLIFPTIDFSLPAVTTTGQRAVQTTAYSIPQNPFTFLKDDRGPSDFDVRHRGVVEFTWDIPRTHKSGIAGAITRGWLLSSIVVAQTGQPYTTFVGPILNEVTQRASSSGKVETSSNAAQAIDQSTLALPPCPRFGPGPLAELTITPVANVFLAAPNTPCTGNTGRNQFVGPTYTSVDAAIQKNFHVGNEQRVLSIRVEAFNLFNRANFYNPISVLSQDGFNLNPDFGKIKSAHEPRQVQFAARFSW